MSRAGKFSSLVLMLLLAGCKKSSPAQLQVDCQEDLDCYITRARECLPVTVVHRGLYPLDWNVRGDEVPMTIRYEVHGWVRDRCHVSRTQLHPPWELPDAGPRPQGLIEQMRWERWQEVPFSTKLGVHAPLMQCLYESAQAAGMMERVRDGLAEIRDIEPCYPGDGRCGTLPRYVVGCASRECLLGRWTFVCDDKGTLRTCEGTRLADNTPWEKRCVSWCGDDGQEVLDCDFFWPERRRAKLQREAEAQRLRALGLSSDAGLPP